MVFEDKLHGKNRAPPPIGVQTRGLLVNLQAVLRQQSCRPCTDTARNCHLAGATRPGRQGQSVLAAAFSNRPPTRGGGRPGKDPVSLTPHWHSLQVQTTGVGWRVLPYTVHCFRVCTAFRLTIQSTGSDACHVLPCQVHPHNNLRRHYRSAAPLTACTPTHCCAISTPRGAEGGSQHCVVEGRANLGGGNSRGSPATVLRDIEYGALDPAGRARRPRSIPRRQRPAGRIFLVRLRVRLRCGGTGGGGGEPGLAGWQARGL